jgi:hypothetical protein
MAVKTMKPIRLWLRPEVLDHLRAYAHASGTPIQTVMRRAVEDELVRASRRK